MNRSLIILFLAILLLCGAFLRAATNNKATHIKKANGQVTKVEVKKEMEFIPNLILL